MKTKFDIDHHLNELITDGFTILEDAIHPDEASHMVEAIERLEQELGIGPQLERSGDARFVKFEGDNTYRVRDLVKYGAPFEDVPLQPDVLAIVERVLGFGFLLQTIVSIVVGPGQRAQALHADDFYLLPERPHRALSCNTIWALTDFTEANGATRVVPGSHLSVGKSNSTFVALPEEAVDQTLETIPAVMKRGSIMIMHGSVFHGAGANFIDERRFAISVSYCAGWIRQQCNLQLGLDMDLLRSFKPRLQELIGVRGTYRGLIGNIGRPSGAADPADVLFGG